MTEADRTIVQRPARSATPPPLHALLLREEDDAPRRIMLGGTPLSIGRSPLNALVLASPDVSRQHCTVSLSGSRAALTDLHSTNGSYVDGVAVHGSALLHPGARIAVGPFTLVYYCGSAEELEAAEASEREQARAVRYIQALLPPPLATGPVRADWVFVPSARLGGDVFGYRWLEHGAFVAYLLDVSGHGLGSALLAASAANALRVGRLNADPADPAAVLGALNAAFQLDAHDAQLFSFWYGVYELDTRRLRYASAGHHPAYLACGRALVPLATRGPAIGMAPGYGFTAAEADIPVGARLYLFSDGAFEIARADGAAGSIDDVRALIAAGRPSAPELFEAIRAATGRRPFENDVSLLTFDFPAPA